jgi:hypothetical protein
MTLDTIPLRTGQHLSDLALDEFKPVKPDLAVELDLSVGEERRRVDLLVELDRTGRPSSNGEKFRRYDALITAWSMSHRRYTALGEPPVVVFVVEDGERAVQFLRSADNVITGRLGKWGTPEAGWAALGRRRIFFVSEIDAHQGTLRALRLSEHPPKLRRSLRGRRGAALQPEQVPSLLPAAFLKR